MKSYNYLPSINPGLFSAIFFNAGVDEQSVQRDKIGRVHVGPPPLSPMWPDFLCSIQVETTFMIKEE